MRIRIKATRSILIKSLLLLSALSLFHATNASSESLESQTPNPEPLIILTDSTFNESISKSSPILVYFHRENCEACKRINSVLTNMSQYLLKQSPSITTSSFDCDKHASCEEIHNITQYPTIRLFSRSKSFDYAGEPSFESLILWSERISSDPVLTIIDEKDIERLKKKASRLVFFNGQPEEDKDKLGILVELSQENLGVLFAQGNIQSVYPQNSLIFFKNYDEGKVIFEGPFEKSRIQEWIDINSEALVENFDTRKSPKKMFREAGTNSIIIFTDSFDSEEYRCFLEEVRKLKGEFVIARTSMSDEHGKALFSHFEAKKKTGTDIWIIEKKETHVLKYRFAEEKVTQSSLRTFFQKYKEGLLSPEVRSQEVPIEQSKEGVVLIVGKNFEELVARSPEHFALLFFVKECRYSIEFAPIYDEIANKMTQFRDRIKFGVIDGANNEVPKLEITGFPTLLLFKAGEKDEPVEYAEQRTKLDLLEFLIQELSSEQDTDIRKKLQKMYKETEQEEAQERELKMAESAFYQKEESEELDL